MSRKLEAGIGHSFRRSELLDNALIHRSFSAENPAVSDNERMEFLGDAVLQLVVTEFLYLHHPDLAEGEMAKVRAACVNKIELARLAREIGVGPSLTMAPGEELSGGRDKDSILSDAMEAILAAVYLDGGLAAARTVILRLWTGLIDDKARAPGHRDYKTRLQEALAAKGQRPEYRVSGSGPDHARRFLAVVSMEGRELGRGSGRSKKEAEQAAARAALTG